MESICLKLVQSLVHVSYQMANWKCVRNVVTKVLNISNEARGNSIYHFVSIPVSVHWKQLKKTKSY